MDTDQQGLVLMLLREGSIDHAVEVYREESGTSPAEARRAVRDLARDHGITLRRTRYLPLVLLAVTGLIGSLIAGLAL